MSFCCGSEMLLTMASTRSDFTTILNVPVLFCVICEKLMIHPEIEFEYEVLKDFAMGDRAKEVDLEPYIHPKKKELLYHPAHHVESLRMDKILQDRIDQALDLLSVAHQLDDHSWKKEMEQRLYILNQKTTKNQG